MKKLIALLFFLAFASCSTDENINIIRDSDDINNVDPEPIDGVNLFNYTQRDASGRKISYNFNEKRGIHAILLKEDDIKIQFDYNDEGYLSDYVSFNENILGETDFFYSFEYDGDKIDYMEWLDNSESFFEKLYGFEVNYDGNKINIKSNAIDSEKFQYLIELNSDSLITSLTKNKILVLNDNDTSKEKPRFVYNELFTYDDQKNCTKVIHKEIMEDGQEVTNEIFYEYDTNKNPLYNFYSFNYLQMALIYAEYGFEGANGLQNIIKEFGTLNHTDTVKPNSLTGGAQVSYENEYNDNGTLKSRTVTNFLTGKELKYTEYFYE